MRVTSKSFLRKTKRGNILKIVREHYLRDDIGCGSQICKKCKYNDDTPLQENPPNTNSSYKDLHYILVDTNVVIHQIDALEDETLKNVIILQTVLEEVKHLSHSVYKRLLDIMGNYSRCFYTFVNVYHNDTYVERTPGESPNDYNDRMIRVAAQWYNKHLGDKIKVLLLSSDEASKAKAIEEGIPTMSLEEYIKGLNNIILADKLSNRSCIVEETNKELIFPPHFTPAQIHQGIRSGSLMQGTYFASSDNFLEGSVFVEGQEKNILLQGRENLNRAINGDIVAVRLFPESEWSAPANLVIEDYDDLDNDTLDLNKIEKPKEKFPTGQVVGIIRKKWRQYCGIIQNSLVENATRHLFVPAEKKIPKIRIETRQYDKLKDQRVIVAIDSWPRTSRYPLGHFVRSLGKIGERDAENEVILLEHDVPHSKFSDQVLKCLPKLPWLITAADLACRKDFRDLDICSVDPPGCTDIDDALHCKPLENGNFQVGVHIADVTHFVKPGSAIDVEASQRATTVYLTGRRIDMVPELLSSNLCSLRGGEERLAFSCIWEMDPDANIVNRSFTKSVIKSKAAMTYEQAQLIIDDQKQNTTIANALRQLNKFAKILKKRRLDDGALVLASPEIRFLVDSETRDPLDVEVKQVKETNSMVEEFMLLANIEVAKKIYEDFPEFAVLRRHPKPPPTNFESLIKAAAHLGVELNVDSSKDLANSLDKAVKLDNPFFNTMLRILATRCMMQAVYFASGTKPFDEFLHYGLAAPIYTHFTSPIRRYADILVHRLLAVSIAAETTTPELLDKRKIEALCQNLNVRTRMSAYAERASVALNTHIFFRGKIRDEEGYILYVRKNALQILIPKYGLEGTLFLAPRKGQIQTVTFIYNEEEQTQRCGEVVFRTFDPVSVQLSLDSSNVQHERIILKLVKPKIPEFSVPSSNVNDNNTSNTYKLQPQNDQSSNDLLSQPQRKKAKK
ncbi:exosome complex exonuclease RRP44 [Daktulosphaira vitifoliae]|uniref:exosome complex exonuclease RRP44 n=1 Tax=Daktulosphaira vitifoliae TaxID=58002 RepID=UPI0021AA83F9|nr:exosome complex exonuclease RRP44 [Daktulosphaira vitifoliae]